MASKTRYQRRKKEKIPKGLYFVLPAVAAVFAGLLFLPTSPPVRTKPPQMKGVTPEHIPTKITVAPDDTIAKREAHLESILSGIDIPNCESVEYDHNGEKLVAYARSEYREVDRTDATIEEHIKEHTRVGAGGEFHAFTINMFEYAGQGRSTKIFVGRKFFENYTDDKDKRHAIGAIQAQYVKIHAEGLKYMKTDKIVDGVRKGLIDQPVLYEICSLEANYKGLLKINSGEFPATEKYRRELLAAYNQNLQRLATKLETGSSLQRKLVKKAMDANTF